jgi:hypothetical protein
MKRRKTPIVFKKERVILSDILPFETPVTFSNRHFYQFLIKNKIQADGNRINWELRDDVLTEILLLLFGISKSYLQPDKKSISLKTSKPTIPFKFNVSHKESDFRTLTVTHPRNQLFMVEFYEKYKDLILYYSSQSPFSLRRPFRVAKFTYWKDKTHFNNLADNADLDTIEENDKEYEHLRTYFKYKDYSNIHKFFESYKYHRCEKKYNKMHKIDISKCFDSIYTHSLSWAIFNKEIVKELLKTSADTFSGVFDSVMQDLNYGETNGIVIGPEYSRIFAELILQRIDRNIVSVLKDEGYYFKKDYEIYRYVDDFFIFYNHEICKEKILKTIKVELNKFNFHVNEGKSKIYEKPLITEITIAKQKISDLINKYLTYQIKETILTEDAESVEKKYSLYVSSNKLITKFKTVVKETGVEYKDILNYTLAAIDRKVSKLIKDFLKTKDKKEKEAKFTEAITEILDFSFFIYSVSPRVNTTIKLCMILSKVTKFYKINKDVNYNSKHLVFKKISDDISLILKKNANSELVPVETLYLLIALRELGREYRLDINLLCEYFGIDPTTFKFKHKVNYFSIVMLIFYIGDKIRYKQILDSVKVNIMDCFIKTGKEDFGKHGELVLLLFDTISCPYINRKFKMDLLRECGIVENDLKNKIIDYRKYWFTKWSNFKFAKEMEAKKSIEVY